MARPENGCLAMISNQFAIALKKKDKKEEECANVAQSMCGKLSETYPERHCKTAIRQL
jgi:hypothetical protein